MVEIQVCLVVGFIDLSLGGPMIEVVEYLQRCVRAIRQSAIPSAQDIARGIGERIVQRALARERVRENGSDRLACRRSEEVALDRQAIPGRKVPIRPEPSMRAVPSIGCILT